MFFVYKYFLILFKNYYLRSIKVFFVKVFFFYVNGFKSMTIGRTLWVIILLKLFLMFVVLKFFFFPNFLKSNYKTEEDRQQQVIEQLTHPIQK